MFLSRRDFLGAVAGSTALYGQNEKGTSPANPFDVNDVLPGMGLPKAEGPSVVMPFLVKKYPNQAAAATFYCRVYWGLLAEDKITAGPNVGKKTFRDTPAFLAQFNPEVFMNHAQLRQHIGIYANNSDGELGRAVIAARENLRQRGMNSTAIAAVTAHLINVHGAEYVEVNGLKQIKEVREAKLALLREKQKSLSGPTP